MSSFRAVRFAAVIGLLAVACGSAPHAVSPTATASPAQLGLCAAPSNLCLALVTLRGSNAYVVRDITDMSHPRTVSNLGMIGFGPYPSAQSQFVSATELSFVSGIGIVRMPLSGTPKSTVAEAPLVA